MPRRKDTANAGGSGTARAISEGSGTAEAEPIEGLQRSKPGERQFAPGLYVVATPIGNARDITLRALDLLRAADLIACEDTRVTAKLMARYAIATPRVPYHEHNAEAMRPKLIARLKENGIIALVSDAGTPLISDPGYKLVRAALAAGIAVTTLPGPSAPLAALVLSGLPSDRFLFAGFLPSKEPARRRALAELAGVKATLLFFEAAPRLADSLADMAAVLGDRPAAVARELTKLFEEVRRDSLAGLAAHYRTAAVPRGEIVVVVGPPEDNAPALASDALDQRLVAALATMSLKDASAVVAAETGLPRRIIYARALALAGRNP